MKAINVVLLPPQEIIDMCVKLNAKSTHKKGILAADDFVPHISLVIGWVENEQNIIKDIEEITQHLSPLTVHIKSVDANEHGAYWFTIEKTARLQQLHEKLMKKLQNNVYFKNATQEMFFKKEGEPDITIPRTFTNGFITYAFERYNPHISLRILEKPDVITPILFTTSTIALFHIGENCTSRQILWETKLINNEDIPDA